MRSISYLFLFFLPYIITAQQFLVPWGMVSINDPALLELINHPVMQRLKKIDQSGPVAYIGLVPSFTRFDHSVGVLALLQDKASAPFNERVAGLLHDVSHTAFSHVGDQIFHQPDAEHSYQDLIHLEFLSHFGIDEVAAGFGLTLQELDPDRPEYRALEQSLPDLCADRIEYLIHTAANFYYFSKEEISQIIENLRFENGRWFFTNQQQAEKFALLSVHFTKEIYGAAWNCGVYAIFAELLKDAVTEGIITQDDIRYGKDLEILNIIENHGSEALKNKLKHLKESPLALYIVTDDKEIADTWITPKFRGVDPWVQSEDGSFKRLTELSESYRAKYTFVKNWCHQGYGLQFIDAKASS